MIPLYILGFLFRFGPQHGYQIKKLLAEQAADFTDIKLPTIYYHLEKMESSGLITAQNVKEGVRPEKRVYCISEQGKERFHQLLCSTLDIKYRPTFETDALLFFSDYMEKSELIQALENHKANLKGSLERIGAHKNQVIPWLPEEMKAYAGLIFSHHEHHYQAELKWAEEAVVTIKEGKSDGEDQNH
ncbi:PadR family transcriptional regulator [Anaerolentibacter hominis]|uniref:PadR family transcriptional regulator n=1 Tax=Anaerolentibacter hominis TaxID=3079009 RepID=UPI0031B80528